MQYFQPFKEGSKPFRDNDANAGAAELWRKRKKKASQL